ncbi:hypothetical protein KAS50_04985, partial [bacterium]|nr:hypothetical protein [bacterium]
MIELKGNPASPGISIGTIHLLDEDQLQIQDTIIPDNKIDEEIEKFLTAIKSTEEDLLKIKNNVKRDLGPTYGDIFDTHLLFLKDKSLIEETISTIKETKQNSSLVFYRLMKRTQNALLGQDDKYLKERASDIGDIKRRVIRKIHGDDRLCIYSIANPGIVVSRELTPS